MLLSKEKCNLMKIMINIGPILVSIKAIAITRGKLLPSEHTERKKDEQLFGFW